MRDWCKASHEEIKVTVKQKLLIERLELEDVTAEDIDDEAPLFVEGLGLDSVEAFEVMVGLEVVFGVMVEGIETLQLKAHLHSVDSISRFIKQYAEAQFPAAAAAAGDN